MKFDYQLRTLTTALIAASVSILQPCFGANSEVRILLADSNDGSPADSVLYRPRWSVPGTGHLDKLAVPPQPIAPPVPEPAPVVITPVTQTPPPVKRKNSPNAPFAWPQASDDHPVPQKVSPVVQKAPAKVAVPVKQAVAVPAPPTVAKVAPTRMAKPVSTAAKSTQTASPSEIDEVTESTVQPAGKIPRLNLSPPAALTPITEAPETPSAIAPSAATRSAATPTAKTQPGIAPNAIVPSAIIPSLSSGNLGEPDQNSQPAEAPMPGANSQSAGKSADPAAFDPPAKASVILQAIHSPTLNTPLISVASTAPQVIEAGVSMWDTANIDKIVETLVDSHFDNSKEAQELDQKVEHFSKAPAKAVAIVKDSLNTSMRIGGNDPSSRGGKIVLEEKLKVTNQTTAEYERQRYVDKIHSQIVSSLAQIAMGLGTGDPTRRSQIIDAGAKSLSSLVGDEKARNTVQGLTTWLNRIPVPEETFKKQVWDTMERETKLETILKAALAKDPVVAEVRKRVERYAHPGKVKAGTSKVVEGTLATVSWLSPGFAIPIGAEVALDSYIAATGGSEESKLEKELIYDKRIQSRLKVLDQEATQALDNYRFAVVTKNPALLAFSEALIADLASQPIANEVLVGQVVTGEVQNEAQQVIPGIKESKDPQQSMLKALSKGISRL